jgi:hypothetical protein
MSLLSTERGISVLAEGMGDIMSPARPANPECFCSSSEHGKEADHVLLPAD